MCSRVVRTLLALGAAAAAIAPPAVAQDVGVRGPGLHVGAATGISVRQHPLGLRDPWERSLHSVLAVGLAPRRSPLELRAELTWVHWGSDAGPVSLATSVVAPFASVPIGHSRLRPYAIAGVGVYGVGSVRHTGDWNAGAGLALDVARSRLYVEGRRLGAYRRDFLSVGFAIRP